MRKDSGFEVVDKIKLYVADNALLEAVVKKFAEYIKGETLAVEILYNSAAQYTECSINGDKLNMSVEVVKA